MWEFPAFSRLVSIPLYVYITLRSCFNTFRCIPQSRIGGNQFFEESSYYFSEVPAFTFLPSVHKGPNFFKYLPTPIILCFLDSGHLNAVMWCLTVVLTSSFRMTCEGFPAGSVVKSLPAMQETWVPSLGWEDPLEKEMATHSSLLAWEIPCTEESGGLQPVGLQKSQTWLSD